jgi:hypothetical protein
MPSTGGASRPGARPGVQPSYGGGNSMSRDYNARQRGSQRSQQFNRGASGARPRAGGGLRR